MSMYFEKGAADACSQLGITKEAIFSRAVRRKAKQLGNKALEFMIGNPRKFMAEARAGKAFAPKSLIRQSFEAPGFVNKAMFYGLPALEAAGILTGSSEDKASELGGLLGGSALGIAAFKPFGMVGAMGAGILGDVAGRSLGHLGQKAVNAVRQPAIEQPQMSPYGRPLYARNPIGAAGYRQMQGMRQG